MKMKHKKAHPLQTYYSRIYKTYDLVNRLFTFGLDKKWRYYTINECLSLKPVNILDLCCGTGDLAILLSQTLQGAEIEVPHRMTTEIG